MTEDNNPGLESKCLTVSDMDRKLDLWVDTVGYQSIPPDSPYPLKEHPSGYYFNVEKGRVLREYQLTYITKGRGLFSSDSTPERQICKGRLIVLFPGQWHAYYPLRQTGRTEYYVGSEGPAVDTIAGDAFLFQERQILEAGINKELAPLFSRVLKVAKVDKISAQQYFSEVVPHMTGVILSISKNKVFEMSGVDQKTEQVRTLMNENVSGNIDSEELAVRLNIGYSWFRGVFKGYTGYAPAKYFQGLRPRKAEQMLVETPRSVKEISFFLDFQSTGYFFSFSKKRTRPTPLEYRSFGRGE